MQQDGPEKFERLTQPDLAEMVLPGYFYLLRETQNICVMTMTLRDPIDPTLVQQALDAVLARAPFFRVRLVWQGDVPTLEPNDAPCPVVTDGVPRTLPEQTNGYLFYFTVAGRELTCNYDHFLTDGRGIHRFLTQLLQEYCNRRYGTAFQGEALVSQERYPVERLREVYRANHIEGDLRQSEQVEEREAVRRVYRTSKADWVALAQRCGAKPFSCMMAAFACAMRECGAVRSGDAVDYKYAMDARAAWDIPEALYNCVAIVPGEVTATAHADENALAASAAQIDTRVRGVARDPDEARRLLSRVTGWAEEIMRQKAPFRVKRRIYQMGEAASRVHTDFWMSYLGNPFASSEAGGEATLARYVEDFTVWVPPDTARIAIEAVSLNGIVTFCVQDKLGEAGFDAAFRTVLKRENITIY
jgi:hypothetical protein